MSKKNKNPNNNFNFNNKNKAAHPNLKNLPRNPEEVKQQLMPLYMRSSSYGKTAMMQGDTVEAERHFQQAEHYMRMINSAEKANAAQANGQRRDESAPSKKQEASNPSAKAAEDISLEGFPSAAVDLAKTSVPEPKAEVSIRVSVEQASPQEKTEQKESALLTTPSISIEAPKKRRGRPPKNSVPKKASPASEG